MNLPKWFGEHEYLVSYIVIAVMLGYVPLGLLIGFFWALLCVFPVFIGIATWIAWNQGYLAMAKSIGLGIRAKRLAKKKGEEFYEC